MQQREKRVKRKTAFSIRLVLPRGGGMGMTSSSSQEYA